MVQLILGGSGCVKRLQIAWETMGNEFGSSYLVSITGAVYWFWSSFVRVYQNITPVKFSASKLIYSSLWSVFKLQHRWDSEIEALKWLENRATTVTKWIWQLIFYVSTRFWWIQLLEKTAYKKGFLLRLSAKSRNFQAFLHKSAQKSSKIELQAQQNEFETWLFFKNTCLWVF